MNFAYAALLGYFCGSFPTAYIVARLFYRINIFEHGSKNMGATNVYRVLGTWPFAVTLAVDVLKGMVAVLASAHFWPGAPALYFTAAAAAMAGHTLSFWVKFKGGKGVATGLGVFMALAGHAALASLGVFMVTLLISRMVSLSSILAAALLPVFIYRFQELGPYNLYLTGFATFIALFVIVKHKTNVQRILKGEESRLPWRVTDKAAKAATENSEEAKAE